MATSNVATASTAQQGQGKMATASLSQLESGEMEAQLQTMSRGPNQLTGETMPALDQVCGDCG